MKGSEAGASSNVFGFLDERGEKVMYTDKKGRQFAVLHAEGKLPYRVVYRHSKYSGWRFVIPIPWFQHADDAVEALEAYAKRYQMRKVTTRMDGRWREAFA